MAKGKKKKHMLFKTILIIAVLSAVTFCSLTGYICIREGKVPKSADELEMDYDAVIVLGAQAYNWVCGWSGQQRFGRGNPCLWLSAARRGKMNRNPKR